jgi:hypothetical protein
VVAFSVRVDKGKDTKAAFGKKLISALSFLQAHIDKSALFFAIDESDPSRPPIKEKADRPIYQVILRRYFAIPNKRAFDNVNQDGGWAIRGSAVMGFSLEPHKCLKEAAGDLRHMGCAIYFKQCQEVNTVARRLLLSAPNTIEEEVIRRTFDKELKKIERRLIAENNAEYKYSQRQLSQWLKLGSSRRECRGKGRRRKSKSKAQTTPAWRMFFMSTEGLRPVGDATCFCKRVESPAHTLGQYGLYSGYS